MARHTPLLREFDKQIGAKVQELRLAKGWSREQLASKVGVTHQQMQKYEKGINRIAAGRLREIANNLDKPVEYFFSIEKVHLADDARGRAALELQRLFLRVQPAGQDAILYLVRNMAGTKQ